MRRLPTAGQGLAQSIFAQKRPQKKPHTDTDALRGVGRVAKAVGEVQKKISKKPKCFQIWCLQEGVGQAKRVKSCREGKKHVFIVLLIHGFSNKLFFWAPMDAILAFENSTLGRL